MFSWSDHFIIIQCAQLSVIVCYSFVQYIYVYALIGLLFYKKSWALSERVNEILFKKNRKGSHGLCAPPKPANRPMPYTNHKFQARRLTIPVSFTFQFSFVAFSNISVLAAILSLILKYPSFRPYLTWITFFYFKWTTDKIEDQIMFSTDLYQIISLHYS